MITTDPALVVTVRSKFFSIQRLEESVARTRMENVLPTGPTKVSPARSKAPEISNRLLSPKPGLRVNVCVSPILTSRALKEAMKEPGWLPLLMFVVLIVMSDGAVGGPNT